MTTNNTSAPPLDLAAIEARWQEADRLDSPVHVIRSWHDVPAHVARIRDLGARVEAAEAARARDLRAVVEAAGEAWDPRHDAADVVRHALEAARREGAEAMRSAAAKACEGKAAALDALAPEDVDLDDPDVAEDYGRFIGACECAADIRALPLPEAPR